MGFLILPKSVSAQILSVLTMTSTPSGDSQIVYIVDDDELQRETLVSIIELLGYQPLVFEDGISFLQSLDDLDHGAVILDVNMPKLNGIEVLRSLFEQGCDMPVIVMSGQADVPMAVEAMRHGAVEFLEKPYSVGTVAKSLEDIFANSSNLPSPSAPPKAHGAIEEVLTRRELEVLRKLVGGQPNKAIANELGLSHRTVEVHRANIMRRLQANSFAELIKIAISLGIKGD